MYKKIFCTNIYDKYYNQQFVNNNNNITNHHVYITIDNDIEDINGYYLSYIVDREKIIQNILKKNNLDALASNKQYNFFKENIFFEVFKELKKNGVI
jgi:hypothetical protein